MQKLKIYILSLLAVILIAGSAHAVSIKGRDISTIDDVLRHARGITNKTTNLEIRKDSILRLHDDGQLDLRYSIGKGNKDSSLGKIRNYVYVAQRMRDDGLLSAILPCIMGRDR